MVTAIDDSRAGRPSTVVTLVPGTWARKAAWTKPDSPLCRALTEDGCEVVPAPSHRGWPNLYASERVISEVVGLIAPPAGKERIADVGARERPSAKRRRK